VRRSIALSTVCAAGSRALADLLNFVSSSEYAVTANRSNSLPASKNMDRGCNCAACALNQWAANIVFRRSERAASGFLLIRLMA
jgi:hypothetical protein